MLKCTSCRQGSLTPGYLDMLFPCHTCDHCGGNWVLLKDYLRWKEANPDYQFEQATIEVEAEDSKRAMTCPQTGKLMVKYRISKDTDHRLDLSPDVHGIWLDKGEWDLLKKAGLAGNLNAIFTDPWQRKIREANAKEVFEQLYKEQFGDDDYQKLKQTRDWINQHPKRSDLLAYLVADDPYSANR
ncbi:zf-TFIIB domain-containing protein [Zooshikella ganghwensis]|uniref:zf-TFIIB domain-containing protein n=1 Tax=Zooshikella ganghwensis TaxID=202772 RepID=UPI001F1AFFE1|nr:zf-TFIIB domain-containing protein [Zooshikella ganghwensis]